MDPPPSAPMAMGATPAATAAALALDEPPVMRPRSQGLRAAPQWGLSPMGLMPISFMFALPTITAPAARRRALMDASARATSRRNFVPRVVA
jgi:hypothetical protein